MIQSEGYVWPAFVAGAKKCTRRKWQWKTAKHYIKGFIFDAYDTAPYAGGVLIGRAKVTRDAYQENLQDCADSDYVDEGFAWLNQHPNCIPKRARREVWAQDGCSLAAFDNWRYGSAAKALGPLWVVRFEIVHVEDSAVEILERFLTKVSFGEATQRAFI